jgi:hypothetical protein
MYMKSYNLVIQKMIFIISSPFFLIYGAEAVLPMDLEYGLPRVQGYDKGTNQGAREDSLNQLGEACVVALMHSARYQQALRRHQARKIRRRDFNEGDLVLRLRQDNRGRHKLSPPWEGPYVVVKVLLLTLDLLLLRLEGRARDLGCLLQAKDRGFLLLDGLALIREGDAQLG